MLLMSKKFFFCFVLSLVFAFAMPAAVLISCKPQAPVEKPDDKKDDPQPEPEPDPDPITGPDTDGDGVIRILAIGNSFSQDAVEQYLYQLFEAAGQKVVIGNLYIGGCRLDTHYANSQSGDAKYEYRKVVDGTKTNTTGTSLLTGLKDENWDCISLQQASGSSGQYSTYTPYLANLITYVKANSTNPKAVLMWHATWAYASSSDHSEFPKYDRDQMTMYNAIQDAACSAMTDHPELTVLIPSGTAIQNGRTSYIGDAFNRDGYHLEVNFGRYTAACTWYEAISGNSVVGNAYAPASVSDDYKEICQAAAHAAVLKPYEVTDLVDFKRPKVQDEDMDKPVQIDFGGASTAPPATWNRVNTYASTNPIYLRNTEGQTSAVQISSLTGFSNTHNGVGSENATPITIGGVEYPCSVWCDGVLVSGTKGQGNVGPAKILLSGFKAGQGYDFTVIAVRFNGSFAARKTELTLKGSATSETKTINQGLKSYAEGSSQAGGYDNYYASFENVTPNSDGEFTLEVVGVDTTLAADGQVSAIVISKR